MNIIFLDTEATDLEDARLVQLAYKNPATGETVNEFVQPPVPISFGAMAIHHITNEMVADKPAFTGSAVETGLRAALVDTVVVAHNAPYDISVLKNEGVVVERYIDTLRVARHMIKSDQYSLQYLRYSLGLNVAGAAHDALGDVLVLEALYNNLHATIMEKFGLASDDEVVAQMMTLTNTPALLNMMHFGKHRGKSFEEVAKNDVSYLQWLFGSEMQKNETERNQELVFTLKHHLNVV